MEEIEGVDRKEFDEIMDAGKRYGQLVAIAGARSTRKASALFGDEFQPIVQSFDAAFSYARQLKYSGNITDPGSLAHRNLYICSFIAGTQLTRIAILGGYNMRAAALIRQEFEIASRVRQFRRNEVKVKPCGGFDGRKVAPPTTLDSRLGRLYGKLSEHAHASTLESITSLGADIHIREGAASVAVPLIEPRFKAWVARDHMLVHLLLCCSICEELAEFANNTGEFDLARAIVKAGMVGGTYLLRLQDRIGEGDPGSTVSEDSDGSG